jgi:hypothetical protein
MTCSVEIVLLLNSPIQNAIVICLSVGNISRCTSVIIAFCFSFIHVDMSCINGLYMDSEFGIFLTESLIACIA